MNVFTGTGRLTKDPEVKYANELCIAEFSFAINRTFKNKEGKYEADFFDVKAFGKTGEFVEKNFKKGMKVEIRGKLQQDRWTTQEGQNRSKVYIVAEEVSFGESKAEAEKHNVSTGNPQSNPQSQAQPQNNGGFMDITTDIQEDLPFM